MNIKDKNKSPDGGWRYLDPDLKVWTLANSFEELVASASLLRVNRGLTTPNYFRQMIEDQICDYLPADQCSQKALGDAVHAIAKPIAKVLDQALGTSFESCGACAKRRARLNS